MTPTFATEFQSFDFQKWAPVASSGAATLAVIVAIVSCVYAARSFRKSSRSLELSEAQEKRKNARLDCEIDRTAHWSDKAAGVNWIGVYVLVSNPSELAGAASRAELIINYEIRGKTINHRIPADMENGTLVDTLAIPCRLEAYSADNGWLTFTLHDEVVHYSNITMATLELTDTREIKETVPVWPIREVVSDPRT
ncbi:MULTISPECIES: hypothetical protein [Nocardiaceae]|uniref:hypothetical protein n=1 Tax=Nocardiaceae TaxID=85025 RepID=UPI0005607340|nr:MULTISPECIES: hypothetical protein [Rhodococcus]OZD12003.1 hypothetical protein CH248_28760 [Rhodococcus sp. 06-156-4a]OZD15768.1 hypothetical protein CH253_22640 [Rhodococcus sp. 06-156-3C]OZD21152.1 hypothetical protein CH280_02870 [Rhodococcus sp. 06-156-4C]OZD32334.1 hypothetical protein CH284_20800 [Rhodococcus sp. 06-156-3]OZD36556.1 hypothetical protein CH247_03225 [Rhodococcus sp. 06-156-3b]